MILPLVQTIPASGQERVNIENTKWEAENQKAIWRSAVGTNQLMIIHLFVTMLSQPRVGALLLCVAVCSVCSVWQLLSRADVPYGCPTRTVSATLLRKLC